MAPHRPLPKSKVNILGPWNNTSQRKACCYTQADAYFELGLNRTPVQVFQMTVLGTIEEQPHPGGLSFWNLDHRGFWVASTIWANSSELPIGEIVGLPQSSIPTLQIGSFQSQWHPPTQTILKQPRSEYYQVSSPQGPPHPTGQSVGW